jgi:TfoX N-terminal domain
LVADDPGMAYDEDLANRIRELIADEPDVSEESMFGGLVFIVGGKMSVAAGGQGSLIVRVDPEDTDEFLAKPHAHPFVMGGRPMEGRVRVRVDAEGVRTKTRARALGQARRSSSRVTRSSASPRTAPSPGMRLPARTGSCGSP